MVRVRRRIRLAVSARRLCSCLHAAMGSGTFPDDLHPTGVGIPVREDGSKAVGERESDPGHPANMLLQIDGLTRLVSMAGIWRHWGPF